MQCWSVWIPRPLVLMVVLDFEDLFAFVQPTETLGQAHGSGRPYPMVSGPSLSGGVFDDEQHRFGPNDLLRAPQRTTKPLGWHISTWEDCQKTLAVIKDSWSAGRTFNDFL